MCYTLDYDHFMPLRSEHAMGFRDIKKGLGSKCMRSKGMRSKDMRSKDMRSKDTRSGNTILGDTSHMCPLKSGDFPWGLGFKPQTGCIPRGRLVGIERMSASAQFGRFVRY